MTIMDKFTAWVNKDINNLWFTVMIVPSVLFGAFIFFIVLLAWAFGLL